MGAQAESHEYDVELTEAERARIKATIARIRDDDRPAPVRRGRFARFTHSYFGGGRIPRQH
jgi:hypothetical protein